MAGIRMVSIRCARLEKKKLQKENKRLVSPPPPLPPVLVSETIISLSDNWESLDKWRAGSWDSRETFPQWPPKEL